MAARALEARFDAVLRSELHRMQKKIAPLEATQRSAVEDIAAAVVLAIAARPAHVLGGVEEPSLVQALVHVFDVSSDPASRVGVRRRRARRGGSGCCRSSPSALLGL